MKLTSLSCIPVSSVSVSDTLLALIGMLPLFEVGTVGAKLLCLSSLRVVKVR
jgi:hypothetical protein